MPHAELRLSLKYTMSIPGCPRRMGGVCPSRVAFSSDLTSAAAAAGRLIAWYNDHFIQLVQPWAGSCRGSPPRL